MCAMCSSFGLEHSFKKVGSSEVLCIVKSSDFLRRFYVEPFIKGGRSRVISRILKSKRFWNFPERQDEEFFMVSGEMRVPE